MEDHHSHTNGELRISHEQSQPHDEMTNSTGRTMITEDYKGGYFTDKKGNLKVVNLVVRYPCLVFFNILLLSLGLTILLIAVVFTDGNPFTTSGSDYDINDVRSVAYDSFRLARDEVKNEREIYEQESSVIVSREQEKSLDVTYWVFESESKSEDGLFGSAESINAMRNTITLFIEHEDYEDYCWKAYVQAPDNSTQSYCRPPLTALNMYFASSWDAEMVQSVIDTLENPMNVEKYNALALCVERGAYCDLIPEGISTEYNMEWAIALNKNISSIMSKFDGRGEELVKNFNQVTLFAASLMQLNTKKGMVDFGYDKNFGLHNLVSYHSRTIIRWGSPLPASVNPSQHIDEDEDYLHDYIVENFLYDMNEVSEKDYSPSFNAYYFMSVLRSTILLDTVQQDSMLAIFSIVFVFLFIRLSVGSWFLAFVGILQIILSIPVSWFIFDVVFRIKYFSLMNALCLFIVAAIGADDIFIFMDAYKQSAYADPEILESLESRMSWVYRRAGGAMAITSATTCAAFLSTLITPLVGVQAFGIFAAIVIFLDYILVMTLFCTAVVIYHNRFERPGCCTPLKMYCKRIDPTSTEKSFQKVQALHNGESPIEDRISKFFRTKVAGLILSVKARIVVALIFISWLVVASIYASRLEPTNETEQFLDENHPLQKSMSILSTEFPKSDEDRGLPIYFAVGIEEVDRAGVNLLFDPEFYGEASFSETFEFNEQCQTDILAACDMLRTSKEFAKHVKQEGGLGAIECFVEEFGAYSVLGNLNDCDAVKRGEWKKEKWAVPLEDLPEMFESFTELRSCYSDEGERIITFYKNTLGWDPKHSIRYASFALESSKLDPFSTKPRDFVREEYDAMLALSEKLAGEMGESCKAKIYMTDTENKFVFMNNQDIYVDSAIQSAIFGIAIAFTVLMISTKVFHISFFATLNIACVLVSVIGVMVMLDWSLGSIEAILISILAGFSVDYVVHLAHSYERGQGKVEDRIRSAFGEMGISVFNGMITSFVGSLPLFFCQLQFFSKFGTFLCATIMFSWVFSNFAFMSLLAQLKVPVKHSKGCRL